MLPKLMLSWVGSVCVRDYGFSGFRCAPWCEPLCPLWALISLTRKQDHFYPYVTEWLWKWKWEHKTKSVTNTAPAIDTAGERRELELNKKVVVTVFLQRRLAVLFGQENSFWNQNKILCPWRMISENFHRIGPSEICAIYTRLWNSRTLSYWQIKMTVMKRQASVLINMQL